MQRRFGDLDQFDARRAAAALATPALVIHDVGDPQVPFAEGEALARAWPGARLRALHGLGHNRPLKDADVVRESLAFIAGTGGDAAGARPATPALRSIGLAGWQLERDASKLS
jgi:pimeloyl-ACP methyl ester carboxylesterase